MVVGTVFSSARVTGGFFVPKLLRDTLVEGFFGLSSGAFGCRGFGASPFLASLYLPRLRELSSNIGDFSSSAVLEAFEGCGGGNLLASLGCGAPDSFFGCGFSPLIRSEELMDFLLAGSRSAFVDSDDGDF